MKETAKKAIKTGFGLGLLTLAQGKKLVSQLQKELGLNQNESVTLAKEFVKSSQKASEEVMCMVGKHIENAIINSGLAKKNELRVAKTALKNRVKKVIKKAVPKKTQKNTKPVKGKKK